jgi:hypothetical protein
MVSYANSIIALRFSLEKGGSTALLAIGGLFVRFLYDGMSDRVAESAIFIPASPAVLGILSALRRQVYVHRANDAIVQEDE